MNPSAKDEKVAQALGGVLADTYTTYVKAQSYHWNVTGPMFYSLHLLFEQIYTDLAQANDAVAERIRALGAFAPGSFGEFSAHASVKHDAGVPKAEEMIADLARALEAVNQAAEKALAQAAGNGDTATEDLLTLRIGAQDKFIWMLKSHLA